MTYSIPAIPPSDNTYKGRKNVWQYRNDKVLWEQYVQAYCRPVPQRPIQRAEVVITYYFPTRGRRDPDNYSGKFLLDGLVRCGILADDSFDNVNLVLRGGYDKENPRTEIEITEVEHG